VPRLLDFVVELLAVHLGDIGSLVVRLHHRGLGGHHVAGSCCSARRSVVAIVQVNWGSLVGDKPAVLLDVGLLVEQLNLGGLLLNVLALDLQRSPVENNRFGKGELRGLGGEGLASKHLVADLDDEIVRSAVRALHLDPMVNKQLPKERSWPLEEARLKLFGVDYLLCVGINIS